MQGVVERLDREGRSGVIWSEEEGRDFRFDGSGVDEARFDALSVGAIVSFEKLSDAAASQVIVMQRQASSVAEGVARPADAATRPGVPLDQLTPPEVRKDEVTEASWESFPASDPPAWRSGAT